jgi:hypothetical protein
MQEAELRRNSQFTGISNEKTPEMNSGVLPVEKHGAGAKSVLFGSKYIGLDRHFPAPENS